MALFRNLRVGMTFLFCLFLSPIIAFLLAKASGFKSNYAQYIGINFKNNTEKIENNPFNEKNNEKE